MHPKDRKLNFIGFRPTGDLADLTSYTTKLNQTTWFSKAPPMKPPSPLQSRQRARFKLAAEAWNAMTRSEKDAWLKAAKLAHLHLSGYSLWLWYCLRRDRTVIRTIERQSGQTLLPV